MVKAAIINVMASINNHLNRDMPQLLRNQIEVVTDWKQFTILTFLAPSRASINTYVTIFTEIN